MKDTPTMREVVAQATADLLPRDDEYTGLDGMLYCKKCHGARSLVVTIAGIGTRTVRCRCKDCKQEEDAQYLAHKRHEARERRRRECFSEPAMMLQTFENDAGKKPELSSAMMNYADNFATYAAKAQGLLLYGDVGTGKSYMAAAIANRVIDQGYSAHMLNFSEFSNRLMATWEKQDYIDRLCSFDLLIFDDLGIERKKREDQGTGYMQETVYNIINARYSTKRPMIVTTNLTTDELSKSKDIDYIRIYDRILEKCVPINVDGLNYRRGSMPHTWSEMRRSLGLGGAKP